MTTETRSIEEFHAAKAAIENAVSSILARIDAENEGITNLGQTLKIAPRGVLIHVEIKSDTRSSSSWFVGSFKSLEITLDRWSGNSVRRSVKINGLTLPDGAKAKIEEKVRELVVIALKREADRQESQKAADDRQRAAFETRLEALDAGFEPTPRWSGKRPALGGPDAEYSFATPDYNGVKVIHGRSRSALKLDFTLPSDELIRALELAKKIQALIDEELATA